MNLIEMLDKIKEQLPEGEVVDFRTASQNVGFTASKNQDVISFVSVILSFFNSIKIKFITESGIAVTSLPCN